MHIGSPTLVCEEIKVPDDGVGKTVDKDKNVGAVMAKDGSNTENIKERTDKGSGIVNNILSILSEIPFVHFRTSVV